MYMLYTYNNEYDRFFWERNPIQRILAPSDFAVMSVARNIYTVYFAVIRYRLTALLLYFKRYNV